LSEPVAGDDIDPAEWADPAVTYDKVASSYAVKFLHELDHKPFDRELLTRFAETLRPRAGVDAPVCDLGCGPGHIGAFLAELGVDVVGIDLSEGMVAQAHQCYPSLRFSQGDMTALDLPDQSLSGIACFYALIHIPRSRVSVALEEMHRVLVEGGALLVAVHGGRGTLHATEMLEHAVELDATLFSLPELSALLGAAGFDVVEAHERAPFELELATPRLYVWATRGA
jgi:ubiquinone/menaquinone biosynthesis C-methylase UbiE